MATKDKRNIFKLAVQQRQANVYNLIHGFNSRLVEASFVDK